MNSVSQLLVKVVFYGGSLGAALAIPYLLIPTSATDSHAWILTGVGALLLLGEFAFARVLSDVSDLTRIRELASSRFDSVMDQLATLKHSLIRWWVFCVVLKVVLVIDGIVLKTKSEAFPGHVFFIYFGYVALGILMPTIVFLFLLYLYTGKTQEEARRNIRNTLAAQKAEREIRTAPRVADQGNHYSFFNQAPRPS